MNFVVTDTIETRSDDPNLIGYRVYLDFTKYVLYYDKDQLREVYLMSRYPKYFMSCRTDMETVSHYYIIDILDEKSIIKRYENGKHNRTYTIENDEITTCIVDGVQRVYTLIRECPNVDENKLYDDLVTFLKKFNDLDMDKLFVPKEPI